MGNMMGNMMSPQQMGYPPPPGYGPPGYPPPQGYPPPGYPPPGYPPQQGQYQQAGYPPPQPGPAPEAPANDLQAKLQKLKAAFEAGLLTEQEYAAKKAALLDML
jgi:hypothetical protein